MYRAVALRAQVEGIDPKDEPAVERLCANLEISFQETGEGQRVICQGEDVTERVRDPEIGWMASVVSTMRPVRESMATLQRRMGSRGGVVAEGRDLGTVVFPGARFKFFLVADPRERSLRRYRELKAKGREIPLEEVEGEVRKRDALDSSRELAPLQPAEDAHLIDSTGMTAEEVVAQMLAIIQKS
jgi:cytidylate kinase